MVVITFGRHYLPVIFPLIHKLIDHLLQEETVDEGEKHFNRTEETDLSSRQTILCGGESAMTVMMREIVEQNLTSGTTPTPTVRVVRGGAMRLTVVLDRTQSVERYRVTGRILLAFGLLLTSPCCRVG